MQATFRHPALLAKHARCRRLDWAGSAFVKKVDLLGRLSRPAGPLKALLDKDRRHAKCATDLIPVPHPTIGEQHRRMAWVAEAAEQVLAEHGESMQAKAIHAAVERRLRRAVSWSSVKNALADGTRGRSPRFERVARGRYQRIER